MKYFFLLLLFPLKVFSTNLPTVQISNVPLPIVGTVGGSGTFQTNITNASIPVTGTFFQATQPVSGTLTCNAGSGTLSTTFTNSTIGVTQNTSPWIIAGAVTTTGTTAISGPVSVTQGTSPWVTAATGTTTVAGTIVANAGTNLNTSALALESGGHLASIDGKVPALGQALANASVPVVLTAAQLSTLTPLSTVAVTQNTNPWTVAGTVNAAQSGTWTTGRTWVTSSASDSETTFQGGNWTNRIEDTAGNSLTSTSTNLNTNIAMFGGSAVTLGQNNLINSIPVALASNETLPLPTNAAQETGGHLASIDSKLPSLGATAATGSIPVVQPPDILTSTSNITVQDTASTTTAGFANQSQITGTPTAGSTVSLQLNSIQTIMVIISGTWTGTLATEISSDGGTTWVPRSVHVVGTSTFSSSITANMEGSMNTSAKTNVRVRAISAITGTAVIRFGESDNPSNFYIANSIKLVDGSATPNVNTLTILAGSVAPTGGMTAAVTTLRDPITTNNGSTGTATETSVSCATTTTTLLAAASANKFIIIRNPTTATGTVWINIVGASATTALPSIDIPPGGEIDFQASENSFLPTAQINCISGAAGALSLGLVYK